MGLATANGVVVQRASLRTEFDPAPHLVNDGKANTVAPDGADRQAVDGWPAGPVATALLPDCLLYTSPRPRDRTRPRMPSSACKKYHLHTKHKNKTKNTRTKETDKLE